MLPEAEAENAPFDASIPAELDVVRQKASKSDQSNTRCLRFFNHGKRGKFIGLPL
jgi:hypothetical protein